jgi:DNA-binding MarR family transcriptional regulator
MGDISKDIKSSFKSSKVKALINIKYTSNWLNSKENDFFKPYGISPQQFNILRILRGAKERIKVQLVKDRMIERAPNATRLMDKLCDKNLKSFIYLKKDTFSNFYLLYLKLIITHSHLFSKENNRLKKT